MRNKISYIVALALAIGVVAFVGLTRQQDKSKRPSPPAKAQCSFPDGKTITTDYSSPRLKGRKVIPDINPYGKPWRAGANEATTFVTTADLTIDDKIVPAGSYTLFAIPNQDQWTLIISKKTGEWGIPYPGEQYELGRYNMKVSTLPSQLEDFTIAYDQSGDTCALHLDWDMTRAAVDLKEKK